MNTTLDNDHLDLEAHIRAALADDSERAPTQFRDFAGLAYMSPPMRRGSTAGIAAAATVAAAAVAGFFVVSARDDAAGPAAFQPGGVEYPLQDLGPATSSQWITTAGITRAIGVPGHPDLVVATVLEYSVGETAVVYRCLSELGSAGCNPEWNVGAFDIGITSSVDNRVADDDLWTWANLPSGTSFVTYVDGDRSYWQRPLAGVAIFPNMPGSDELVTAYAFDGTVLAEVNRASVQAANEQAVKGPLSADISQAQYDELVELTAATMAGCLTTAGATIESNVATFPEGADEVGSWDACATQTKTAVSHQLQVDGVRFYDPATESPTSPDPALHTAPADEAGAG